jgi:hypothetical protein
VVGSGTPGGQCQWSSWGSHSPAEVVWPVAMQLDVDTVMISSPSEEIGFESIHRVIG